jgi:hypothetical protein
VYSVTFIITFDNNLNFVNTFIVHNPLFPFTFDYKNCDQLVYKMSTNYISYLTSSYMVILCNTKLCIILSTNFCYSRERFRNEVHIVLRCRHIYFIHNFLCDERFLRKSNHIHSAAINEGIQYQILLKSRKYVWDYNAHTYPQTDIISRIYSHI